MIIKYSDVSMTFLFEEIKKKQESWDKYLRTSLKWHGTVIFFRASDGQEGKTVLDILYCNPCRCLRTCPNARRHTPSI